MTTLRLAWVFLRVGVMKEAQYRANFFLELMRSLIALGTGLAALALVFSYTNDLAGWLPEELLVVMGVHILVGGLIRAAVQPNMARLMNDVERGTLDYTLTKPEDAQVLISVREVEIWALVDVAMGAIVLVVGVLGLDDRVGAAGALGFAVALLLGFMMIYSVWLMLTTGAFWFVRIGNVLEIFQSFYQAGRWPVGIYPPWLRAGLTVLVPVAFAVTVPAEALTGRLTPATLGVAAVVALVLTFVARRVLMLGLKNYSGASA